MLWAPNAVTKPAAYSGNNPRRSTPGAPTGGLSGFAVTIRSGGSVGVCDQQRPDSGVPQPFDQPDEEATHQEPPDKSDRGSEQETGGDVQRVMRGDVHPTEGHQRRGEPSDPAECAVHQEQPGGHGA